MTLKEYTYQMILLVAEVVPLKQGLKPNFHIFKNARNKTVAEVVPLKQGLKPIDEFQNEYNSNELQR